MAEVKLDTTNPFNEGVTYEMFLKNVTKKRTVNTLLNKLNLTDAEVKWIKQELNNYKNNNK